MTVNHDPIDMRSTDEVFGKPKSQNFQHAPKIVIRLSDGSKCVWSIDELCESSSVSIPACGKIQIRTLLTVSEAQSSEGMRHTQVRDWLYQLRWKRKANSRDVGYANKPVQSSVSIAILPFVLAHCRVRCLFEDCLASGGW